MNVTDLSKRLSIEVLPVYFLKGEDAFLIEWAIRTLSALTDADYADFNLMSYEDAENMKDIIIALNTVPVFADRRIVIVKSSENLDNGDKSRLEAYLKEPSDFSVLVIVDDLVPADMQYKRESPLHGFYKYGEVVTCSGVTSYEFSKWINAAADKRGASIEQSAVNMLNKYTGGNMTRAVNELYKLSSYAEGKKITADMVEIMVTPDNEYKTYALSNALAKKNNDEALDILQSLIDKGESPSALLSLITSQYRRMLEVKISSLDIKALSSSIGASVPALNIAKDLAASYTPMKLKTIVDKLHALEFSFKSGDMNELAVLYEAFAILLKKK